MQHKSFLLLFALWSLISSSVLTMILGVEGVAGTRYRVSENSHSDFEASRISPMRVDKRIELLSAVQILTSLIETGIQEQSYQYKEDMLDFFEPFNRHKAVSLCEDFVQSGFVQNMFLGVMIHLSDPPALQIDR